MATMPTRLVRHEPATRRRATGLALGLLLGFAPGFAPWAAGPAAAQEAGAGSMQTVDPAYLSLGAGIFDVTQDDDQAADFRLEYRHDEGPWLIRPFAGVEVTTDGGVYGLGGVLLDWVVVDNMVITPSFGIGAFEEGDGKDLGHTIEFRSQIELGYRFTDRSRLSVAFSHISNAGIGDDNPGTEVLTLYYAVPFGLIFGGE